MRDKLLNWYKENKRDLPWRRIRGPYAVLVSEMMLQQTTVETVLRYYKPFMDRFPDVYALAAAQEQDVLSAWQGLGYYSRARNLYRIAKFIVSKNQGAFPESFEAWRALPGVGPYMAGAVMSIAFGKPYPAVDGNVLRVVSRLFGLRGDISQPKTRKEVETRVAALMADDKAGDFTQALMELGALICRPVSPACLKCPWIEDCTAMRQNVVDEIPVKKQRTKPRIVPLWAAVIETGESVLLEYRENESLLARMWGLPLAERKDDEPFEKAFADKYGIKINGGTIIGKAVHVFTHQRWEMQILRYRLDCEEALHAAWEWTPWAQINEKPIPTAFLKVLKAAAKQRVERTKNE